MAALTRLVFLVVPSLLLGAFPAVLMSSDSTIDCTTRGSGFQSPNLSSVPRSVRYNTISVLSVAHSGHERKRRASKQDDFSESDQRRRCLLCFPPHCPLVTSPSFSYLSLFVCAKPSRCTWHARASTPSNCRRWSSLPVDSAKSCLLRLCRNLKMYELG